MLTFYDHGKASMAIGAIQQTEIRNKQLTHIIIRTTATDFNLKMEANLSFHSGIAIDNYKMAELKRIYDIESGAVDALSFVIPIGHLQMSSLESLILYVTNTSATGGPHTFQITSVEMFESQDFLYMYHRSTVMNNTLNDVNLVMLKDSLGATDSIDLKINGYNTIVTKDCIDSLNALLVNENYDDQTCDILFFPADRIPGDVTYEIKSVTPQTILYRMIKLDVSRVAAGTPRILDEKLRRIAEVKKRSPQYAKAYQYLGYYPEEKATQQTTNYLKGRNIQKAKATNLKR